MTQDEALKILKMGKNIFLTGAAGTGKTYVLNKYIRFLRDHGVEVAVTASTGIAATHLKGVTIHSWSGIGIKNSLTDYDLDNLIQKSYLHKRFEKTKVLIIDEISMLNKDVLDCVDMVAKTFKRNNLPFGGMQVVFSGDFFQLPPIERNKKEESIFMDSENDSGIPFAFKAKSWANAKLCICYLREQFRQEDNTLLDILNEIREGEISQKSFEILNSRIVDFDKSDEVREDKISKLFTHNLNVDAFNQKKLDSINAPEKKYEMFSRGRGPIVDSLRKSCLAPEVLILKKGALVMFVKNNPSEKYVNGTTGEVVDFENDSPVVLTSDGNKFVVSPQSWTIEEGSKILAEVSQIPLKLAWAITVHKSQGMTLSKALIDLSNSFVEGQGYVALSRVASLSGLYLTGFNRMAIETHNEVRRIDRRFKLISDEIFKKSSALKKGEFDKESANFIESIGGKKFKVLDKDEKKIDTRDITLKLFKESKTIKEIAKERKLKEGTILEHLCKLKEMKKISLEDISHLKPKGFDKVIKAVAREVAKMEEIRLKPIFEALDKQYSYDDIKMAILFL